MGREQLDLPGFRGLTPAPPAADVGPAPKPPASPPEPPPVRAPLEQLRQLDELLAASGPPAVAPAPPPPPALHRRAVLPSVAAAEARASRVAALVAELNPQLDPTGIVLVERLGRLTVETVEAGDLTYLEVVIEACRAEGALLEDVLATGRHDGPVKLARDRAFYELYCVMRTFAALALVWGCNKASVRAGVYAHEARLTAAATAPAANVQWVELDPDAARTG